MMPVSLIIFIIVVVTFLILLFATKYKESRCTIKTMPLAIDVENNLHFKKSVTTLNRSLENNEALVLSGTVPFRYMYWSISTTSESNRSDGGERSGGRVSSLDIQNESNNDGIFIVLTRNKKVYDLVEAKIKEKWSKTSNYYKLNIHPFYIEDICDVENLEVVVGIRDPEEILPQFTSELYSFSKLKFIKPTDYYSNDLTIDHSRKGQLSLSDFNTSCKSLIKRYHLNRSGRIKTIPNYPNVNSNMTEFSTKSFNVKPGQTLIVIGVDHHKNLGSHLSVIEVYDKEGVNVKSLITGDSGNYYPYNHHPEIEIIELKDPGEYYVKECIYPDFKRKVMIPHEAVIPARVYIV
jgi:hypothetical protein